MKLDHVVYFSKKTPGEIVQEKKALGYHVVIGGQHKQWGTENALLYVKNAYVEWLTTRDLEIMQQATNPLIKLYRLDLEEGEGWGTICLSVNQIDQYNEQLQKKVIKRLVLSMLNVKRPVDKFESGKCYSLKKNHLCNFLFHFLLNGNKTMKSD